MSINWSVLRMEIETKDYSTKKRLLGKLDCIICDSGGLRSRFPSFKKKKKKEITVRLHSYSA